MTNGGTKHLDSLKHNIFELHQNHAATDLLNNSENFILQLKKYRQELDNETSDNLSHKNESEKELSVNIDYYNAQTSKYEKHIQKGIKMYATRIDKLGGWNLDTVYKYNTIDDDTQLMMKSIIMDLLYQGKLSESKELLESLEIDEKRQFVEVYKHFETLKSLIESLHNEDYTNIYDWIGEEKENIMKISSLIENLNMLVYFQVLEIKAKQKKTPPNGNLLLKCQNEFDAQVMNKIKDKCLSLDNSTWFSASLPELNYFDKEAIKNTTEAELIKVFNKYKTNFLNLKEESPLNKCLLAGNFAIDTLLKFNLVRRRKSSSIINRSKGGAIVGGNNNTSNNANNDTRRRSTISSDGSVHPILSRIRSLNTSDNITDENAFYDGCVFQLENEYTLYGENDQQEVSELPLEIELPEWMSSHTVFVCPVLKEETTETNKPCMLPCRHFISRLAMNKLVRGVGDEIKCPYCPGRSSYREAKEVQFVRNLN